MIKRNCIFLLDKEKGKPDAKVRYRVKWGGNTAAFGLGYRVDVDKWSIETQRCKSNTTHGAKKIAANIINKKIGQFERYTEDIFRSYELNNKTPSLVEFRSEFNKLNGKVTRPGPDSETNFFKVLERFKSECGTLNSWTESTHKKFNSLKSHVESFAPAVTFDDFDERGLNMFVAHLINKRELRNTTVLKQISFLRWFLKWAAKKGYHSQTYFLDFKPKLKTVPTKVIFLDWEELMSIYNFEIPANLPGLGRVRDVFCFCCFTSLRYSDVEKLKRSDISAKHISVTTVKTIDAIMIDLNKYSSAILEKYAGESFAGNRALPVISNQKMNDALKIIGRICGIDKPVTITYYKGGERFDEVYPKHELLTTHAGRRTFICNALMLGIPPQVVMKWTGHSDYKAMKPYIDVADRVKAEAMSLFNK